MRVLGDAYVKNEFKLHKNAKQEHLTLFFSEWNKYLEHVRTQRGSYGRSIEESGYTLTEEQAKQLSSLKEEVRSAKSTKSQNSSSDR